MNLGGDYLGRVFATPPTALAVPIEGTDCHELGFSPDGRLAVHWNVPEGEVLVHQLPRSGLRALLRDPQRRILVEIQTRTVCPAHLTTAALHTWQKYGFNPHILVLHRVHGGTPRQRTATLRALVRYAAGWEHAAVAPPHVIGRDALYGLRGVWTPTALQDCAWRRGPFAFWFGNFLDRAKRRSADDRDRRYSPRTALPGRGLFPEMERHQLLGTRWLDLGGGPWDFAMEYLAAKGIAGEVLDPGARSAHHNARVKRLVERHVFDGVTVCNVLNVIREAKDRAEVIATAHRALRPGRTAYFVCYAGDGSGEALDGERVFQAHRELSSYRPEIEAVFATRVRIDKDWIVAQKD